MLRNLGRRRGWGVWVLGTGVFGVLFFTVHSIIQAHRDFYEPPPPTFNYFEEAEAYAAKGGYLVSSPACKILNVSEWALLPLLPPKEEAPQCPTQRKWTFVDLSTQRLVLNSTAVEEDGYSPSDVVCCFKTIRRGLMTQDSYPDDSIQISKDCVPFEEVSRGGDRTIREAKLEDGFVRVMCTSIRWPYLGDVVYRAFHASPLRPKSASNDKKKNSIRKNEESAPSVVLLGIDSVSRLSFHRTMSHTKKVLQDLGAVELQGYTKVGENTFPNAVAMTTGMEDLVSCGGPDGPYDECPFVWKSFESSGWTSAFLEDVPGLATFNYLRKGFVHRPATFYLRPFMLALHELTPRKSYYMLDCVGGASPESTMAQFTKDIVSVSHPSFVYSWTTNVAHLSPWGPSGSPDLTYSSLIASLNSSIVILLSDHGYRYGPLRQSFAGWYEDKLPLVWIYLPPQVKEKFPSWQKALEINSLRLSSPFDIHATLLHILKSYSSSKDSNPSGDSPSVGSSLLEELKSSRTCRDAGIPPHLCACVVPKNLMLNDTRLSLAATTAVQWINAKTIGKGCIPQKLVTLRAGAILEDNEIDQLVVGFVSNPGEFLFEATVEVGKGGSNYSLVGEVLRMNKISSDVSCVRDPTLEKLCYCKDTNPPPANAR